jgi:hypothetical protein
MLWVASRIQGHRNPFGVPLTEYTIPQLHFILEMAALDEPDKYAFSRGTLAASPAEVKAAWYSVLKGQALMSHKLGQIAAATQAMLSIWKSRKPPGMKPGVSRKGKPIDARGKNPRA